MANHTPGPWRWGGPEWPNKVFSQERHATPMVECNYMDGDAEDIANARLIAAAPALLAALEDAQIWLNIAQNLHPSRTSQKLVKAAHDRARDAIAKAKGGE